MTAGEAVRAFDAVDDDAVPVVAAVEAIDASDEGIGSRIEDEDDEDLTV